MDPNSNQWQPRYIEGYWKYRPSFTHGKFMRNYINVAAGVKRGLGHAPAYWFGLEYFLVAHSVELQLLAVSLVTIWAMVFEWTEVYPHSVPKPTAIRVMGMVFKSLRLVIYSVYCGAVGKVWQSSWAKIGAQDIRRLLAMGATTLGEEVTRNVLISLLVPESGVSRPVDIYNVIAVPMLVVVFAGLDSVKEDTPTLPFTDIGEIFAFAADESVGKGLTRREVGKLLEALLWRSPGTGRRDDIGD
ncbi:hypothetical protein BDZ91DRAFT_766448 [Kalaharituber pfeilii]|nr:hypothetical protein BDZ91DRAFT_766448 [Kalaharituber pfeilii]